ncbi:hypothetical protein [Clostridium sp. AM58-1XD]|uniref:hypothetical protein n=1 Tax=Clostridium sp. AM58-1XD TaxID=2292307 RepID=UPI000E51912F|nr:hypothetical protein [Clostridium sp. AM58-1XD]RGY98699.1 hypothetical protein DXA13_10105 [Clostridium sp. AM58-1XD]
MVSYNGIEYFHTEIEANDTIPLPLSRTVHIENGYFYGFQFYADKERYYDDYVSLLKLGCL